MGTQGNFLSEEVRLDLDMKITWLRDVRFFDFRGADLLYHKRRVRGIVV
jgi:hypothetical protein